MTLTLGRPHEYGAVRTQLDGHAFASKAEACRYAVLTLMVKAGLIRDLVLQPKYALYAPAGTKAEGLRVIGFYIADFEYVDCASAALVTEDVKGVRTALFRWKKRHFELQYGRLVIEVK